MKYCEAEEKAVANEGTKPFEFNRNPAVEILLCQVLNQRKGLRVPNPMRLEFSQLIEDEYVSNASADLPPAAIWDRFQNEYLRKTKPYELVYCKICGDSYYDDKATVQGIVRQGERILPINGRGNGPVNAFINGLKKAADLNFDLLAFEGHTVETGSQANFAAYAGIKNGDPAVVWGAGIDSDMGLAAIKAVVSAVNRLAGASACTRKCWRIFQG